MYLLKSFMIWELSLFLGSLSARWKWIFPLRPLSASHRMLFSFRGGARDIPEDRDGNRKHDRAVRKEELGGDQTTLREKWVGSAGLYKASLVLLVTRIQDRDWAERTESHWFLLHSKVWRPPSIWGVDKDWLLVDLLDYLQYLSTLVRKVFQWLQPSQDRWPHWGWPSSMLYLLTW